MNQHSQSGFELRFLLEDYDPARRARLAPPWPEEVLEALRGRAARFLIEEYDPARRYWESPPWPAGGPPRILVEPPTFFVVAAESVELRERRRAKLAAVGAHAVLILILASWPYAGPPREMTEPDAEFNYTQIALVAPSAADLAELTQAPPPSPNTKIELYAPRTETETAVTAPAPEPLPEAPAMIDEPRPAIPQPLEVLRPGPPELDLEEPSAEERAEATPDARSPEPDEFRQGREMARLNRPEELPAPRAPTREKPRLVLEDPKATMPSRRGDPQLGDLKLNSTAGSIIEAAAQNLARSGGGKQSVGDGVGGPRGSYTPPSLGNVGSGVELLSDPKGIDFRPYLTQVLNSVRRNWFAVLPESARLGMDRGRVKIQFIIAKNGDVPKLVIASESGAPQLDRAAVAGISASLPFPPLPREYTGEDIRLQFVFTYNLKQ